MPRAPLPVTEEGPGPLAVAARVDFPVRRPHPAIRRYGVSPMSRRDLRYWGEVALAVAGFGVVAGWAATGPISSRPGPTRSSTPTSHPAPLSAAICDAHQLKGRYWTNLPALSNIQEGITLSNTSSKMCRLPAFPKALVLHDAAGSVVPPTPLPSPSGTGTASTDYFDYGSPPTMSGTAEFPRLTMGGDMLTPGARAVILLDGSMGQDADQPGCLAGEAGDQLALFFTSRQATMVRLLNNPRSSGSGTNNPSGSIFFTCSAFVVPPVLSWARATKMVGPLASYKFGFRPFYAAAP